MKTRIIGAFVALVIAVAGAFFLITYVSGALTHTRRRRVPSSPDVYIVDEVPRAPRRDIRDSSSRPDPARN